MNTNNEKSFLNQKRVHDITTFTTTDYPEHLSCILWFSGCNMHCPYCYNSDIVLNENSSRYSFEDVLEFLSKRQGLLDGVVLSGGEALRHNLFELCTMIKAMGYKIKLDTNGVNTKALQQLINHNLLDYVALDFKANQQKFYTMTKNRNYEAFEESLRFLIDSKLDFEVRTTLHSDLLSVEDINEIIDTLIALGYNNTYYIQHFLYTQTHLGIVNEPVNSFDYNKLHKKLDIVFR